MKTNLNKWIACVALAAIIFTGCSKQEVMPNSETITSNELSIPEIDILVQEADQEFVNFEVSGGNELEGFYSDNDGLPDAYQVTESTIDEMVTAKRDGSAKRLRVCLSKLELDADQTAKIRRVFAAYHDCKHSVIKRYSNALRELTVKYNARHDELLKALRAGRITKEEFEKSIKALRIEFNRAQNILAKNARVALKNCYDKMLRMMHSILNERQWKAFVACYRK